MEPEDQEWINKVVNRYSWNQPHDEEIDVQTLDGKSYRVVTSGSAAYRHPDLSSVSTRDLLNECYRRRAIEKFSFIDNIDKDYMMHNPDAKEYITRDLMKCLWTSICDDQKFLQDALTIKEETDLAYRTIKLTGEIYVCKHPTKVRK